MRHNSSVSRPWCVAVLAFLLSVATLRVLFAAVLLSLAVAALVLPFKARAAEPAATAAVRPPAAILPLGHMMPESGWLDASGAFAYSRSATVDEVGLGLGRHVLGFAGRLSRDFVVQFQFPFRYAAKETGQFALWSAALLALVFTDRYTTPFLAPYETLRENGIADTAEKLSGNATKPTIIAIVAGLGAFGIAANSPRERETSMMLVEAVFTAEIWTDVLKMASRRERPRQASGGASDWEGPGILFESENPDASGFKSFPSGHSAGMWAVATILAHQYPTRGVVPALSYGTALAMSYSRMAVRAHWLSDVVVGGLIGYGCARQVLSSHRQERTAERAQGLRVGIDASSDYMGVGLAYDF